MLKIDLHIHTQKCKAGDGSKRRISPTDFVKKMHDNKVCICSITNHNKFDLSEYNEIKAIDKELVLFPGIELDVVSKSSHSHIVLICDPDKKEKFYKVFDNELKNK
ncbi:PHP domain-containing protein [Enterococcus faecalis]